MCCLLHAMCLPLVVVVLCMTSHGGYGHQCQLPSHGSMIHCLLTGPLQLTLWEYMQILVKHHCYLSAACLPVCFDGCHTVLHNRFAVQDRHDAMNFPIKD